MVVNPEVHYEGPPPSPILTVQVLHKLKNFLYRNKFLGSYGICSWMENMSKLRLRERIIEPAGGSSING